VVNHLLLRSRPPTVRLDVWTLLASREIESVWDAVDAASGNQHASAQLRRLAAALRDILGMSWEQLVTMLGYGGFDDRPGRRDAALGA